MSILIIISAIIVVVGTAAPPKKGDPLPALEGKLTAARFKHPLKGETIELSIKRPEGIPPIYATFTTKEMMQFQVSSVSEIGIILEDWKDLNKTDQFLGTDEILQRFVPTADSTYKFRVRSSASWPGDNFSPWVELEGTSQPLKEEVIESNSRESHVNELEMFFMPSFWFIRTAAVS